MSLALQDYVAPPATTDGTPSPVLLGEVLNVNPDGTIDVRPTQSRAAKIGMPFPQWYLPSPGDQVLYTNLRGDSKTPIVIAPFGGNPTVLLGSSSNILPYTFPSDGSGTLVGPQSGLSGFSSSNFGTTFPASGGITMPTFFFNASINASNFTLNQLGSVVSALMTALQNVGIIA